MAYFPSHVPENRTSEPQFCYSITLNYELQSVVELDKISRQFAMENLIQEDLHWKSSSSEFRDSKTTPEKLEVKPVVKVDIYHEYCNNFLDRLQVIFNVWVTIAIFSPVKLHTMCMNLICKIEI